MTRIFSSLSRFLSNPKFIFTYFVVVLILPNAIMLFTESTSLLTRVVNVILPLSFYWWAMTLSPKPGKAFWWLFLFIFLDAFELVLLGLYGESPIAVDMFLNLVTTNTTEVQELLLNVLPAFISTIVTYIAAITLSIVSLRSKRTLNSGFRALHRKFSISLGFVAIALLITNFCTNREFNFRNDIFPANSCYNCALAVNRVQLSNNYANASADFSYSATSTRPDSIPQIYVLVIGETARADNFGILGYNRPTTPHLSAMHQSLAAFRNAVSMSNTTHKSVPMLLTPVAAQGDFNLIYKQKGIISAFQQAGFSTAFISNQRRNGSLIDFLGSEAQHVSFLKDTVSIEANLDDDALLPPLKAQLQAFNGHRLFIVLHTYGSHFNYRDRYPQNYRPLFTPDNFTEASLSNRQQLINAYDNTIANTDALLAQIMTLVQAKHVPAAVFYTSDHGEDIFDDSRHRFLHASPIPTYNQIHVPLFVWTSAEYRNAYPQKWQQVMAHRNMPVSTSLVTFHTMLDLAGITSPYFSATDALSNASYSPKQRLYVTDHNEIVPLTKSGLKPIDYNQFHLHNLQVNP